MTLDDRLKRSLDEVLSAASLPSGDLAAAQKDGRQIRRHRRRRAVAGAVAGMLVVAVGAVALSQTAGSTPEPALPASPRDVECAGEVVETMPHEQPRVPAYETPREAAEAWAGPDPGRLEMDGSDYAYLLRDDGSVRARMRLESSRSDLGDSEPSAWSVDGSLTCADEISELPWEYDELLTCAPTQTVVATVRYAPGDGDRQFSTEPAALTLDERDDSSVTRTPGAKSGDATATTSRDGMVHTVVRLLRVADLWRIVQIAECSGQAPGLEPAPDGRATEVVRLVAGHCWLSPLSYDGRTWEPRAEDDFGSGGAMPALWHGYGTVTPDGRGLRYVDLGGAELTLLPTGDPGIANRRLCA